MPKKTKKAKQAAQLHRQQKIAEYSSLISENNEVIAAEPVINTPPIHITMKKQLKETEIYFKQDLKKSLTMIIVLLLILFGLYYANQQGLLEINRIFS